MPQSKVQHNDSRGTLINDGDIVAYNRSGIVRRGVILEQRPKRGYTSPMLIIDPINERSLGARFVGKVSRIKYANTVMVIHEGDHER